MEVCYGFNPPLICRFKHFYVQLWSFGKGVLKGHCKFWILQSFNGIVSVGMFVAFLLAFGCAFFILFPRAQPVIDDYSVPESSGLIKGCNVFKGSWVQDESYPLYNASLCPFAEDGFNCLANGRRDEGYTKWRWQPTGCDIPRFNVHKTLKLLRGKRVVFVGDSLARTQWESLICMLMTGVEDKRTVFEVNGNNITKQIRFLGVRFSSIDLRVDFYRSVFLVQPGGVPKRSPKRVKSTLKLDQLDDICNEWIDSDVLIFNSGHWWTPSKLFEMGCYFQLKGSLKLKMHITTAFRIALRSWASWAESFINANKTRVFFRTFEATHWSSRTHLSCKVTQRPSSKARGRDKSPFSDAVIRLTKKLALPVSVMNVTPMAAFRSDAHVGNWSDNPSVPDCSHWCLPGVPDTWNEIMLALLSSTF